MIRSVEMSLFNWTNAALNIFIKLLKDKHKIKVEWTNEDNPILMVRKDANFEQANYLDKHWSQLITISEKAN